MLRFFVEWGYMANELHFPNSLGYFSLIKSNLKSMADKK